MGHLIQIWVGLNSDRVIFRVKWHFRLGGFGLGQVNFDSSRFRINPFLVQHTCDANTGNFVENLGSGIIWLESILVLGSLSSVYIRMSGRIWVRIIRFKLRVSDQFCHVTNGGPRIVNQRLGSNSVFKWMLQLFHKRKCLERPPGLANDHNVWKSWLMMSHWRLGFWVTLLCL